LAKLLKDLYDEKYIDLLSQTVALVYKNFDTSLFQSALFNNSWNTLELKERMRHISLTLHQYLPQEYKQSIPILKKVFSKMNYSYGLENMIFQDYVEVYGLDELNISLSALEHFTVNSSSEFAIRRFIIKYPKESMKQMKIWAKSENEHIRRLASEGCRPRLPWAIALENFKKNPKDVLEILELLKDDTSKYVQKSVANNLNDISKDHPQIVQSLSKKWLEENPERVAILKQACRTLLKSSDTLSLELFGFKNPKGIELRDFQLDTDVVLGEELEFSFTLESKKRLGKLRIEFAIDFLRKNQKHNKKVFKISEGEYMQNEKFISKSYSFKPISTRNYYKGKHHLSILINGVVFMQKSFMLH